MKLTSPSGPPRRASAATSRRALTTEPGFTNPNRQRVVACTGAPSSSFKGQVIYRMKCELCKKEYGSNGCDIHVRRCPFCQNGASGEPLREAAPMFDFA